MSTGNKLRELRGTRTQNDVAEAVGVTKSSYAMYERDERTPRDEVKIRLAKFFGVSIQDLFFYLIEHVWCTPSTKNGEITVYHIPV